MKYIIFLLSFIVLINPEIVLAALSSDLPKPIFFEEDWQNTPNWSSGIDSVDWPTTFTSEGGGNCTTKCPPTGWTGYAQGDSGYEIFKVEENVNCSDTSIQNQTKCLIYNIQTRGDYGTWHGGRMGKLFSKQEGYNELYVRMKVKYGPTWQWADCPGCYYGFDDNNQVSMIKNIRIGRFWADKNQNSMFNTQGCRGNDPIKPDCYTMPIAIPDIRENPYYYYVNSSKYRKNLAALITTRVDPTYYYMVNGLEAPSYDPSKGGNPAPYFPEDSEWHTLEYRVKMNSDPGVTDGEFEMWIDNSLDASTTWNHYKIVGIPWLEDGALHLTPAWNNIWLPDNMSRFYDGIQQIYFGPVVAYEPLTADSSQTDSILWLQSPKDGRLPFNYFSSFYPGDHIAPAAPQGFNVF